MGYKVINEDNIKSLKSYTDNYFDAIVTDPPYGLGKEPDAVQLMKDWVEKGYHEIKGAGFMGKEWDAFVPQPLFWKEVFRVLKPGGHVVAFYGTRTYDWGVMAMRFAGFEVRDCIQWLYGSGFPKSHNISKAIDKMYAAEREIIGVSKNWRESKRGREKYGKMEVRGENAGLLTKSATEEAKQWDGWGSALKPANEPIVLARKPLEKGLSIAENVLKWGTGGINIDGCRVEGKKEWGSGHINFAQKHSERDEEAKRLSYDREEKENQGRFPANIILTHHPECECKGVKKVGKGKEGGYNYEGNTYDVDGFVPKNSPQANSNYGQETVEDWNCHPDCPIKILDEQSGISKSNDTKRNRNTLGSFGMPNDETPEYSDKGGASRFFYVAKASKSERNKGLDGFEAKPVAAGNQAKAELKRGNLEFNASNKHNKVEFLKNFHPTVKPVKLMQYLVRLVTPPNGIVLDPFCGSGTTGIACKLEGFDFVGIEQDLEYTKIAEARISNWETKNYDENVDVEEEKKDESKIVQTKLF